MNIKILHIGILLFLFITGCGLDSNSSTNPPPSGNCPNGQSLGCDDSCSSSPLEEDACGVCGGDGSTCTSSTIDILYNTTTDIGGFQFNIDGATVTGASGGSAADAGFTISTVGFVFAFSFTGGTIPAGSGTLTILTISTSGNQLCLENVLFSDPNGELIINCPEYTALWPAPGQQVECIIP